MSEAVRAAEETASNILSQLGIDAFEQPGLLPWLLLVLVLGLALAARRRPPSIPWPGLAEVRQAGASEAEPLVALARLLRTATLVCLALVVCGPVARIQAPPEPGRGLDLMLVLDASGSMRALDTVVGHEARTRLDLAKQIVARFVTRRVAEGDRVGLVVFGESAFTQCPLTSDGGRVRAALARVEVGIAGETTALGDALALAVKRATGGGAATESVVVLLTDGRGNVGDVPTEAATLLAAGLGVRVHTVGIGTGGEAVPMANKAGAASSRLRFERHDPDLDTLREIAKATGGAFFAAERSSELQEVYAAIDALERPPRPLPPRLREVIRAEPLLIPAGALLLIEMAIARVWRRRLP